jgi:DNA-binding NarL/FixJ family response regulator
MRLDPCANCGGDMGARRGRECSACGDYRRRHGTTRPYREDGRRERDYPPREGGPTARERQVWALLAQGLTDKAIAAELGLAAQTARYYTHSLYEKLPIGLTENPRVMAAVLWVRTEEKRG